MSRADRAARRRAERTIKGNKPMWRWERHAGQLVLVRLKPWPGLPQPPRVEAWILEPKS